MPIWRPTALQIPFYEPGPTPHWSWDVNLLAPQALEKLGSPQTKALKSCSHPLDLFPPFISQLFWLEVGVLLNQTSKDIPETTNHQPVL